MEFQPNFKKPRSKKSNRSSRRAKWQKLMVEKYKHINHCEWIRPCWNTLGLAHAHSLKKRRIVSEEQYMEVAKLCYFHHVYVEHGDRKHKGTHRRMFRLIRLCIKNRSVDELP